MKHNEIMIENCGRILERIRFSHLKSWQGSDGPIFLISEEYPGVWTEHVYDAVLWAELFPEEAVIAKNHINLFFQYQKEDGQLPACIRNDRIGYGQIQECVAFARLCLRAWEENGSDPALLETWYEACCRWDAWLCAKRMPNHRGLIEMFCGYDTGHDNSGRLAGMRYPGYAHEDGGECPTDCEILPVIAPDMNAVFYGDRCALARMAELLGRDEEAAAWREKADAVKKRLYEVCFDEADRFFYDVDKTGAMRRIRSIQITNLYTERVIGRELGDEIYERYLADPEEFGAPYPFPAVSMKDPSWKQNLTGNSWGFYSQGLTALRTLMWMDAYGRSAEMEEMMRRWMEAWERSPLHYGQELHPITGEPSECSEWYSSCMLYYLSCVKRLYPAVWETVLAGDNR